MAYGNNNNGNNSYKEKNMNTKAIQFYNKDSVLTGSTLILGYWNSFLSLKIHPVLPESKRSESKQFDYETFINIVLTPEKTISLLKGIYKYCEDNKINEVSSFGVPSSNGFIEISNGLKHGLTEEKIILTQYSGIDENGKTDKLLSYEFNLLPLYTEFDCQAGNINKIYDGASEFDLFIKYLEEGLVAMTNAQAHSIRNSYKYRDSYLTEDIKSIKKKLGIQDDFGNNNSSNGNSSFFGNGGKNYNNNDGDDEIPEINNREYDYSEDRLSV